MANEVAALREELNAIKLLIGNVVEVVGIRQEVDSIRHCVNNVVEVADIRKEVEAIRQEKDQIVQQYKSENNAKQASTPKIEEKKADAKKVAPKVEEKKEQPIKEAPKAEPAKVTPKAEPVKETPKAEPVKAEPAKVTPKAEPVKEAPKVEEKAKVVKETPKAEPTKEAPKKAAAPVASGQPPQNQEWNRGDLLSTCCEGYYNLVRKDDNDVNWVLLKHESNTKVRAEAVGSGSIDEAISHLTEKETGFIYIRFQTGDAESKRAKFVLISWCGSRAPIMRKAKMSVHKADVKQIFYSSALEVHATEPSDLDEKAIFASLVRAGGANYNGQSQ